MARASAGTEDASAFQATMPDRYKRAFDSTAARDHAAIVGRRAGAIAHVEIWQRLARGVAVLCVVADDRPGLLSLISAALVACELDVVSAQIYTRNAPDTGKAEAVDLLWVQRSSNPARPVLPADAAQIEKILDGLISGRGTLEDVVKRVRPPVRPTAGSSTRVTFDENSDEQLAVLTVETSDRPGLLLAISQALFRARVQIIASDAATQKGQVVDRFTIAELDGQPIRAERRGHVQMAVLSAIETLARSK